MPDPLYLINTRTYLTWTPVDTPEAEDSVAVPLLGVVSAGQPIAVAEMQEIITVPPQMARRHGYALRVRGHSMMDDQIQDGDLILVEPRQTAENGDTVVARLHGDQVTLKRFYREPEGVRLQPANPAMEPLHLHPDEIAILGIVSGIVRLA